MWQKGSLAGAQRGRVRREVWGGQSCSVCGPLTSKRGLDLNLGAAAGGSDRFKAGWGSHTPAAGELWATEAQEEVSCGPQPEAGLPSGGGAQRAAL